MKQQSRRKIQTTKIADVPVIALPRPDVTDGQIVDAILQSGGFPSLVADKFAMSMSDLLARAKGSAAIAAAFAEMKQRMVDRAKAKAMSVMLGDANTPPDPQMLRWFIERYE
ncbi:MAG: hypothetical protein IJI54_05875 [Kiritimatiellae bacterium]|nr:hypothetical protein [Kiritimatiellia bacterium]